MKNLRYLLLVLTVVAFILGGCRSGRQTVGVTPTPQGDPVEILTAGYMPWSYVEMPVRFELRSPKKFCVSGTAKMTEGEAVLLSFRFFGMEMGSVWLTADSVQAVVKPMNVYFKEDIATLTASTGISVADIQALMMGHIFNVKSESPFEAEFFTSFNSEGMAALDSVAIKPEGHKSVVINYGVPEVSPCGPVASSFGTSTSVRGQAIDFNCRWDVEKAKWNTGKVISAPRISADMRRLSSSDIIKMIKKL